jgi:hypothetical protein
MKLFVTVFCIVRYPLFAVESTVQFEIVMVYEGDVVKKMKFALFSRMQESSIAKFPCMVIIPFVL